MPETKSKMIEQNCVECGAGFWGYNQNLCPPCFERALLARKPILYGKRTGAGSPVIK